MNRINMNLKNRIIDKIVKKNYRDVLNHLKILMEYTKYDIYIKKNNNVYPNNYMDFYRYYFDHKRKVSGKFLKYCFENKLCF